MNPPLTLSTRHGRVVWDFFGSLPIEPLRQPIDVESALKEQRGSFVDLKAIGVEWKAAIFEASVFSWHKVFSAVTLRIAWCIALSSSWSVSKSGKTILGGTLEFLIV
jgi:hypothetical protein